MWKKLTLIVALTGALALAGCAAEGDGGNGGADVEEPAGQEQDAGAQG